MATRAPRLGRLLGPPRLGAGALVPGVWAERLEAATPCGEAKWVADLLAGGDPDGGEEAWERLAQHLDACAFCSSLADREGELRPGERAALDGLSSGRTPCPPAAALGAERPGEAVLAHVAACPSCLPVRRRAAWERLAERLGAAPPVGIAASDAVPPSLRFAASAAPPVTAPDVLAVLDLDGRLELRQVGAEAYRLRPIGKFDPRGRRLRLTYGELAVLVAVSRNGSIELPAEPGARARLLRDLLALVETARPGRVQVEEA